MTAATVVLALMSDERRSAAALVGADHGVHDGVEAIRCASDPASLVGLVDRRLRAARERDLTVSGLAFAVSEGQRWLDLQTAIAGRVNLPTIHERVATAALRGERLRGAAKDVSSAVLLDADGLKLGLLLNGRLYSGATGRAGDIAHLGIDRTGGVRCACGRNGCLTALLECGADAPRPPLSGGFEPVPTRPLGWMAIAAVAVVNTLNPALLILRGAAVQDASMFAWLAAAIRRGCLGPTRAGLLDIARARDDSALVGAAAGFAAQHH